MIRIHRHAQNLQVVLCHPQDRLNSIWRRRPHYEALKRRWMKLLMITAFRQAHGVS